MALCSGRQRRQGGEELICGAEGDAVLLREGAEIPLGIDTETVEIRSGR